MEKRESEQICQNRFAQKNICFNSILALSIYPPTFVLLKKMMAVVLELFWLFFCSSIIKVGLGSNLFYRKNDGNFGRK